MNLPLTPAQIGDIERSTVVHESVDKLHDKAYVTPPEDEATKQSDADGIRDENLSQHPDRVIKNARPAEDKDGLVGIEALRALYGYAEGEGEVRSAYGEAFGKVKGEEGKTYSDRTPEVGSGSGWAVTEDPEVVRKRKEGTWEERVRRGDFEVRWSNFTPLWRQSAPCF